MIYVDLLMAFPGWTWEYIDDYMMLNRLSAIYSRWEKKPPIHWMIASYFGIGKEEEKPTGNLEDLIAMFPTA